VLAGPWKSWPPQWVELSPGDETSGKSCLASAGTGSSTALLQVAALHVRQMPLASATLLRLQRVLQGLEGEAIT
jgi:hypothetical protein